jgi:hypothetical protein
MGRVHKTVLMPLAMHDLRRLGYTIDYPDTSSSFGASVCRLSKGRETFNALIQELSYQPATYRYTVGIVVPDLRKVDHVILWFQREDKILKIPASFLCSILDEQEKLGEARYSGERDRQWRVNFHLDTGYLIPQRPRGLKGRYHRILEDWELR